AIYDRKPISDWVTRRVALLGDAAHPMVPFMGQGAAMALEDAAALGAALTGVTGGDDLAGRLSIYNNLRRARATQIQAGSRNVTIEDWLERDWLYKFDATADVPAALQRQSLGTAN